MSIIHVPVHLMGSRTFECEKGHKQVAHMPFEVYYGSDLRSGPVCPVCIFAFLGENFKVVEVAQPTIVLPESPVGTQS